MNTHNTLIVGIAGGSGSGKTTFAASIKEELESLGEEVVLITQDSYYRDQSHMPFSEREKTNFDHPDAIEFDLFRKHLLALREGREMEIPVYSFHQHTREERTECVYPAPVILVEGILLFAVPKFRDLFDIKIYIDAEADIRLLRRLERDLCERGRDFQGTKSQYLTTVKPMHETFVESTKCYADIVIPHGGKNPIALGLIVSHLRGKNSYCSV